jgi:hypothetical protein
MTSAFFQRLRPGLYVLLGLAALSVAPTYAQDSAQAKPRIYQVDVIVFRNLNPNASSETFPVQAADNPDDPGSPDNIELLLSQTEPANSADSSLVEADESDLLLPDAEPETSPFSIVFELNNTRKLNKEYERINSSVNYQPILYATWRQEVADKATAEAFDIELTGVPADVLDGEFRLYRERYMHLVVDLQLPEQGSSFGNSTPLVYSISQSRRLRNADIQYFDHPKFSVISLVTEIVEPETAANTAKKAN